MTVEFTPISISENERDHLRQSAVRDAATGKRQVRVSTSLTVLFALMLSVGTLATVFERLPLARSMPLLFVGLAGAVLCGFVRHNVSATSSCSLRYWRAKLQDAEEARIQQVRIGEINQVLPVDDLEDSGPGFLVRTRQDEVIYVAGQRFSDALVEFVASRTGGSDSADKFPSSFVLCYWPHAREISSIELTGTPPVVLCRGVSISRPPVDETDPFVVLPREDGGAAIAFFTSSSAVLRQEHA